MVASNDTCEFKQLPAVGEVDKMNTELRFKEPPNIFIFTSQDVMGRTSAGYDYRLNNEVPRVLDPASKKDAVATLAESELCEFEPKIKHIYEVPPHYHPTPAVLVPTPTAA